MNKEVALCLLSASPFCIKIDGTKCYFPHCIMDAADETLHDPKAFAAAEVSNNIADIVSYYNMNRYEHYKSATPLPVACTEHTIKDTAQKLFINCTIEQRDKMWILTYNDGSWYRAPSLCAIANKILNTTIGPNNYILERSNFISTSYGRAHQLYRKFLDEKICRPKIAELDYDAVKQENIILREEIASLQKQLSQLHEKIISDRTIAKERARGEKIAALVAKYKGSTPGAVRKTIAKELIRGGKWLKLAQDVCDAIAEHAELADNVACVVCFDREKNMMAVACNHLAVCYACSLEQPRCVICRAPTEYIKVFSS